MNKVVDLSMVRGPRLAWSMVDKSPWPAPKLTRARPLPALVVGKGIRLHGEMEGVPSRLTSGKTRRRGQQIGPAMRLCGGGGQRCAAR
jgi:hypothetical protein